MASAAAAAAMGTSALNSIDIDLDLDSPAAAPPRAAAQDTSTGPNGIAAYELPRSKVLKLSKASLPSNVKMQKEIAPAITRASSVFISYLATLAHESALERGVKTVTAEDVLDALDALDWGEGDTERIRKDLKKHLRAYRANAKAKKAGKPLPYPADAPEKPAALFPDAQSSTTADAQARVRADDESAPEASIVLNKGKGRALLADDGTEADDGDEAGAGVVLRRDDTGGNDEGAEAEADEVEESPAEEDEEEEDDEAGGDEDEEEDEEEPDDPDDGLLQDDALEQAASESGRNDGSDQDMDED